MTKKELLIKLRENIVTLALKQINKPYIKDTYGTDSFDCAGLAWYVYKQILNINIFENGYGLSTTTKIMTSPIGNLLLMNENDNDKKIKIMEKGDILLIHRQSLKSNSPSPVNKYPGHCGIYIGNGQFIHATTKTNQVSINNIDEKNEWNEALIGLKRILK